MGRWLVCLVILTSSLIACDGSLDISSANQIYRTVTPHPNREGLYLVYYRYKKIIEEYGPGWVPTLAAVRKANSNDEIKDIWEQALNTAAPKYMKEKGLIPAECVNGVTIVSSNTDEAGGGVTVFRCK